MFGFNSPQLGGAGFGWLSGVCITGCLLGHCEEWLQGTRAVLVKFAVEPKLAVHLFLISCSSCFPNLEGGPLGGILASALSL